jgi:heat shock protein HslJ
MTNTWSGQGRRHRLVPSLAGLGIMLGVLGCGASGASPGGSPDGSPAATDAAASAALDGTSWRLTDYTTQDGKGFTVPAAVTPTASFAGGSISGNAGCNQYQGLYLVDGSSIGIATVATTKMACPGPAATVETAYLEALGLVKTFDVQGDTLTLAGAGGTPQLKYARVVPSTLAGPTWVATGVNTGTGAVSSMVAGTTVTAVFAADGTVSGSGGCNTYSGPYTTDGEKIAIGPLGGMLKLCGSPEGVDAQEAQFPGAMQRATSYAIEGNVLKLRAADGALQVSFEVQKG